jgi:hypothetical protein
MFLWTKGKRTISSNTTGAGEQQAQTLQGQENNKLQHNRGRRTTSSNTSGA